MQCQWSPRNFFRFTVMTPRIPEILIPERNLIKQRAEQPGSYSRPRLPARTQARLGLLLPVICSPKANTAITTGTRLRL